MSAHGSTEAFNRYEEAGRLASAAYRHAAGLIREGKLLSEICRGGDSYISAHSLGQINDGVCHPLTVQLDRMVCNHAPDRGDPLRVADTQLVKLQVGAHVDGYGAVVGGNIILEGATDAARHLADEAVRVTQLVLDSISPGTTNHDLVVKVAEHLAPTGYRGVPGLLAHSHSRFDIQGPKCIDLFPFAENANEVGIEFEDGEVYSVEVWLTDAADPTAHPSSDLPSTLHQIPPSADVSSNAEEVRRAFASITEKASFALFDTVMTVLTYGQVGTFPFHSRSIRDLSSERDVLKKADVLATYPPFTLTSPGSVSQSVVSFIVTAEGVHVLSPDKL